MEGLDTANTYIEAGLPNITGISGLVTYKNYISEMGLIKIYHDKVNKANVKSPAPILYYIEKRGGWKA